MADCKESCQRFPKQSDGRIRLVSSAAPNRLPLCGFIATSFSRCGRQQAKGKRSTRTSVPVPACTSRFGPFLAVVIAGVANDRVNVMGASLRSVLDQKRWALDSVIGSAAIGRRPVPGKVGFVDFCLERGQSARGGIVGQDMDPGADQVQEGGTLIFLESGTLESLRLNRSAILTGSEHEVPGSGAEHGLLLLLGIEHVDEGECQIVLRSQGPHRLAISRERVWLRAGVRRR